MIQRKKLEDMSLEELWTLFPIEFREYNKNYPLWYKEKESEIVDTIGEYIYDINHIGSTAIPSIISKAIVDIQVEVKDNVDILMVAKKIAVKNWNIMQIKENLISLNYGYTIDGYAEKVYHLHLRKKGDDDAIYFKNYLNKHIDIAKEYEKLKIKFAEICGGNRDYYTDMKTDFVKKYTALAKELKMK